MTLQDITFTNAPINEVVCGISHEPLTLSDVDRALFWTEISGRFPHHEIQPLIARTMEEAEQLAGLSQGRIWLKSADGCKVIQLQSNRFLYNWRSIQPSDTYPRFNTVYNEFEKEFLTYRAWLKSRSLDAVPIDFELTYINHFTSLTGWRGPEDTFRILKFIDPSAVSIAKAAVKSHSARLEFKLDEASLIIDVKNGMRNRDKTPVMVVELSVSGPLKDKTTLVERFKFAHSAVVEAFCSMTTADAHNVMGRKPDGKGHAGA